ncbi:MAG TPA: hypothetical protein VII19_02500 [Acidimicrobiales bacterium]|nr:hypothetical protein [Acidimicrobiales bacterium]
MTASSRKGVTPTLRALKAIRAHAPDGKPILRWRNADTNDPEILALECMHRAMLRGEARRRWGQPRARAA